MPGRHWDCAISNSDATRMPTRMHTRSPQQKHVAHFVLMHPTNDIPIRGCHSIGCGHSDPGHSDVHSNATRSDSRMLTYYVADGLIVANHAHESALGCIALALVRARLRLEGSIPLHLQGYRTTLHLLLYLLLLFEGEMTLKRISPQRLKMAGNLCGSRCVELRQAPLVWSLPAEIMCTRAKGLLRALVFMEALELGHWSIGQTDRDALDDSLTGMGCETADSA